MYIYIYVCVLYIYTHIFQASIVAYQDIQGYLGGHRDRYRDLAESGGMWCLEAYLR